MNGPDHQANLLAKIEPNLARPWSQIAFSADLEAKFKTDTEPVRVRLYTAIIAISMVLFDCALLPEKLITPDAFARAEFLNLLVVTPLTLVTLALLQRRWIGCSVAAIVFLFMILLASVDVMLNSRAPGAVFLAFAIPLILVFSSVLPLPFKGTVGLSLVCMVTIGAVSAFHPDFEVSAIVFAFFLAVCMAVFMLLATYRLEVSDRRSYLLALAATARATILAEHNRTLKNLSDRDGLTGIGNRRFFDLTLARLWRESARTNGSLALLMIDIDHFKRLNDAHGHLGGDECIRAVAELIQTHTADEAAFRFGGEEFAVLLNCEESRHAGRVAERLRAAVETMTIELGGDARDTIQITVSIGHATALSVSGTDYSAIIAAADESLYHAKRNGRNRVHSTELSLARNAA